MQKALRKNRDERYQTIKEMLADLRGLKGELEAEAPRERLEAAIVSKIKRHSEALTHSGGCDLWPRRALAYYFAYFVSPAAITK